MYVRGLFIFLFGTFIVNDIHVLFRDQRDPVFFRPGDASFQHCRKENARHVDELGAGFLREFDVRVDAVRRVHDTLYCGRADRQQFRNGSEEVAEAREACIPEVLRIAVAVIHRNFREILGFTPFTMAL